MEKKKVTGYMPNIKTHTFNSLPYIIIHRTLEILLKVVLKSWKQCAFSPKQQSFLCKYRVELIVLFFPPQALCQWREEKKTKSKELTKKYRHSLGTCAAPAALALGSPPSFLRAIGGSIHVCVALTHLLWLPPIRAPPPREILPFGEMKHIAALHPVKQHYFPMMMSIYPT